MCTSAYLITGQFPVVRGIHYQSRKWFLSSAGGRSPYESGLSGFMLYGVHGELVVKPEPGLDTTHGSMIANQNLVNSHIVASYFRKIELELIRVVKNEHDDCCNSP